MSQLLESLMLISFGLSWPMSVVNNIRARTARGMSLPFILLILFGYISGIAAKLLTGNVSLVLIVYLVNFAMVACNLFVYIRNVRLDRRQAERK
ncbi:MAG: hypothetical protein IJC71_06245 [Clostridia bacterium]|nr:hypothetical protein [Clostridia bacterium]